MANLIPLKVDDFSGGMSDFYVGGALNKTERLQNFYINENADAITRPGCRAKYNARIDNTHKIRNIVDNRGDILMQASTKVKYWDGSAVQTIASPNAHDVFTAGSDSSKTSFTYWNRHTIAATDAFSPIQKIYKDENGDWTTTNLGLPELVYPTCLLLANELKADFNAHIANGTEHNVADAVNTVTAANATDMASLMTLTAELLEKYQTHQNDADLGAGWSYHFAQQATSHRVSSTTKPETLFGIYTALKELKAAYNAHDADATAHGAGSAHQVTQAVLSASGAAGTNSYIYGFHFVYRYMVEEIEFLERGAVELLEVSSVNAPNVNAITISNIPVLASGSLNNWDDSNVKIQIFRTTASGGTLFYLAEIDNGTTSYTDTTADTTLDERPTIYIEGGIVDNDMPPPAKYVEMVNDTLILAHVKEGDIVKPNKVRICRAGIPSAAPEDFFPEDFEDEITGLSSVGVYPIVFLENAVYRLEGSFDSFGRGGYVKRLISQRIGCLSAKSIVKNEQGVYWASDKGFHYTDGFRIKTISTDLGLRTYPSLSNKDKIHGTFDKGANRVVWAVQVDGNTTENDTLYVAHVDYRTEYDGHPFAAWNGGRDADNFSATAVAYIDGYLYRADQNGYLIYHDDSFADDAYVDTAIAPNSWATQTIFYDMVSPAFDFGQADVRKWVSKIVINAENASSLGLQISSSNDRAGVYSDLVAITKNGSPEWGDPSIVWAVSDIRWNYFPIISEWRHFPASTQALRCQYKSVKFTNAYTTIDDSSYAGPCSITTGVLTGTVALLSYPTNSWLSDAVNYYISFEYDDYENEYLITAISSGNLTIADTESLLTNQASTGWRIRGYKKREVLNIVNYTLMYVPITMTQDTYRAGT